MSSQETGKGQPGIGLLYTPTTQSRPDGKLAGALEIFGSVSVTSQFKVSLHLTASGSKDSKTLEGWLSQCDLLQSTKVTTSYDFFCSETNLPGASLDYTEEFGSRQGVTEYFPTKRVYPSFDMTFYVDANNDEGGRYKTIRLFEEWLNFINPLYTRNGAVTPNPIGQGNAKNGQDFFKMRYPSSYRKIISITKFERDFRVGDGKLRNPGSLTYRMIDAFPYNITAIPLTYEGSIITKTRVSFLYSRYVLERDEGESTR
jgi:hypothetical protein